MVRVAFFPRSIGDVSLVTVNEPLAGGLVAWEVAGAWGLEVAVGLGLDVGVGFGFVVAVGFGFNVAVGLANSFVGDGCAAWV